MSCFICANRSDSCFNFIIFSPCSRAIETSSFGPVSSCDSSSSWSNDGIKRGGSSSSSASSSLSSFHSHNNLFFLSKLKELKGRSLSSRARPYFRQFQGWEGDSPRPPRSSLILRPLLFAASVTLGSLAIAAIWRDEKRRREPWANRFGLASSRRYHDFYGWQYTTAQAVCGSLLAANTVIFLCWTRSLRGVSSTLEHAYSWLNRYFLHYAFSGRGFPLLGSTFSHITLPHFAFNMFALFSFGQPLVDVLGPENFLACYLSAGVLSSLGGMMIKLMTTCTTPSLGASGAVLFMASLTALLWPSAQFGIIFLPFISLPAQTMLLGIVALDISGLVLGWRMFDHGAHLAAVATGFLFVNGGAKWISEYQHYVVKVWRDMRARKV
mmetsp:Transcript_47964/g.150468  ORF Transcript_47964/g.150468 Transcript_47964/m.150468 type:complete len:382 (+) Transcript_47964:4146-5291(+)